MTMRARTILAAAIGLGLMGCNAAGGITCQSDTSCRGTSVLVCCTSTQCEYRHEGHTYPCAGIDCTAAAITVNADCPCLGYVQPDAATDAAADGATDAATDAPMLDAPVCVR